eukprot:5646949-Prymnesium_polylepis.2
MSCVAARGGRGVCPSFVSAVAPVPLRARCRIRVEWGEGGSASDVDVAVAGALAMLCLGLALEGGHEAFETLALVVLVLAASGDLVAAEAVVLPADAGLDHLGPGGDGVEALGAEHERRHEVLAGLELAREAAAEVDHGARGDA